METELHLMTVLRSQPVPGAHGQPAGQCVIETGASNF